jgi:hypothetical protein
MDTYKTFRPTQFDPAGLGLADQGHWLVAPVGQTRDSGCLEKSNFRCTLAALGGESDTVEVHRFGHWGPGWFEIIIIDPADAARVAIAEDIERALADYPVVDEEDFSNLEWETAAEYWASCGVRQRVEYCQRARVSVFAARREELPADDCGRLMELLTRN